MRWFDKLATAVTIVGGLLSITDYLTSHNIPNYVTSSLGPEIGFILATSIFGVTAVGLTILLGRLALAAARKSGVTGKTASRSQARYWAFILALIVFTASVTSVASYYFLQSGKSSGTIPLTAVDVDGTARTIGFGTQPVSVTFTDRFGSGVTSNVLANGTYSVRLLAGGSYSVTMSWIGPFGLVRGTCSAGTLSIADNTPVAHYVVEC